jgi:tetrahydromethanopterin S-methyltransferase subunit G
MKKVVIIVALLMLTFPGSAQEKTLPYTLDDRERLIRVEGEVKNLNTGLTEIKQQMAQSNAEIKQQITQSNADIKQQINTLFGACIALIGVLLAVIFWDRRAAMQPQTEATKAMKSEVERVSNELEAIKNQLATKN